MESLQGCRKEGKPNCGVGSVAYKAFPKVIAAALPRLVKALTGSREEIEKLSRVRGLPPQTK